jgi:UDP-N-acetylglucosamine 2-epimerase (non-hydrolysing)
LKTVVTVTGIRPDFIRMSAVFKLLDQHFNHILIHTGQHYDALLSDVFFEELEIRKPDHNLNIGGPGRMHYHQAADLSVKLVELLNSMTTRPDVVIYLGDSNSVVSAVAVKKEQYRIAHIEAGMRSYDMRMLEEVNRKVCDHCSDFLLVYHDDYKAQCVFEGISPSKTMVVGNTIVEVLQDNIDDLMRRPKWNNYILMDIHRPENFNYRDRIQNIIAYGNIAGQRFKVPVKMLKFGRTMQKITEWDIDLGSIEPIEMMSFRSYLEEQYHAKFLISDSGTAQEETALLRTPVIVPRDFTERPQSVKFDCSKMVNMNSEDPTWQKCLDWVADGPEMETGWLGDGLTASRVIETLRKQL